MDVDRLRRLGRHLPPDCTGLTLRHVVRRASTLEIRRSVVQPPALRHDTGVMLDVRVGAASGWAGTADLSDAGLSVAFAQALAGARLAAAGGLFDGVHRTLPDALDLVHESPCERPLPPDADLLALLRAECEAMAADARIVDTQGHLARIDSEETLWRVDRDGAGRVARQHFRWVEPNLQATAAADGQAQTRSLAGQYNGFCQQGGFEVIERSGLVGAGVRIRDEALALLTALPCPTGTMDVVLMPDQMMLQIHESIGHPLELDRILGDERNFAGGSFVRADMFGVHRYGSEELDVSFDPSIAHEFASFAVDDEGTPARRRLLIERGVLKRPLGGALSVARARAAGTELEGVACARACGWHRPPIDRMANLNIEPGPAGNTLDALVGAVEHGVLMATNVSWSIDDRRDKFQFGCEWGRVIRDGRLAEVVRSPGYRGRSAAFWNALAMRGDASTFQVMGTPYCGKGEPGQVIRVGHASPACLFRGIEVFGPEAA